MLDRHTFTAAVATSVVALSVVVATPAAAICLRSASDESSGSEPVSACVRSDAELDAEAMLGARANAVRADSGVRALQGWTDLLISSRWWADQSKQADETDPDIDVHVGHHRAMGSLVATVELPDDTPTEADLDAAVDAALLSWWGDDADRATWLDTRWDHVGTGAALMELSPCDPECRSAHGLVVVLEFRDAASTPPSPWASHPIDGGRPPNTLSQAPTFDDVPTDHTFHRAVERLHDADVTRGCNDEQTRFCPGDGVTRGQMAAFLVRALDLPPGDAQFDDVPSDHTFVRDIAALADAGVTRGCNDERTRYCPAETVTRAEMAAFLVRALDLPAGSSSFADVPVGHRFRDDIAALADAGITRGCDAEGTVFCPDAPVTRDQMAAFLARSGVLDPGWGY